MNVTAEGAATCKTYLKKCTLQVCMAVGNPRPKFTCFYASNKNRLRDTCCRSSRGNRVFGMGRRKALAQRVMCTSIPHIECTGKLASSGAAEGAATFDANHVAILEPSMKEGRVPGHGRAANTKFIYLRDCICFSGSMRH